jgi:site-specific DNA recombinase
MAEPRVALYARVSVAPTGEATGVASQVAALRARILADGVTTPAREFLDAGYSGATLTRPALERLRDQAALGGLDRLYVHAPDRLARHYAYQEVLRDEFMAAGVEVVFLNRAIGRSPEDDLLLQVQGMMAEFERAKIMERSRRGKRYAAQCGAVSVLGGAPYGYRYVGKVQGQGQARYEIALDEARVVRQMFEWVGRARPSLGEVATRLAAMGVRTRTGKTRWDRTTIGGMLNNPAYQGMAGFGKTQALPRQPRPRLPRGQGTPPRDPLVQRDRPREAWLFVPVPAVVSADLFALVQEQLRENRQRARQGQRGARYLLQGLLCCARCGYAYCGQATGPRAGTHEPRPYTYYRCLGTDARRCGGQRLCQNAEVRTERLDQLVWAEVRALLVQPERLLAEYERRLQHPDHQGPQDERTRLEMHLRQLQQGRNRLIDAYAEGLLEPHDFAPRLAHLNARVAAEQQRLQALTLTAAEQADLRLIVGQLRDFAAQVDLRLDTVDWSTQRAILRALVKKIEVDHDTVHIIFRIGAGPLGSVLPSESSLNCGRGP